MITPPYLQPGDRIALVATARSISRVDTLAAIRLFESWGFEVIPGAHLFEVENQFAGSDQARATDLQQALDDPQIKAIVCARGGYGTIRLMPLLKFHKFSLKPKWLIGYSDVTVLHSYINQVLKIETIHATMPLNIRENDLQNPSLIHLQEILLGRAPAYTHKPAGQFRPGNASAELVGGNLSMLYSMRGTAMDLDTQGKILFIEDVDEYLYHIDRMMMNLKEGGKLEKLAGLIVGGMTDMRDNTVPFGKTAEEIIMDAVKEYNFPVITGFPAGHQLLNLPLILGRNVQLNVSDEATVEFTEAKETNFLRNLVKPTLFLTGFFVLLYALYNFYLNWYN